MLSLLSEIYIDSVSRSVKGKYKIDHFKIVLSARVKSSYHRRHPQNMGAICQRLAVILKRFSKVLENVGHSVTIEKHFETFRNYLERI